MGSLKEQLDLFLQSQGITSQQARDNLANDILPRIQLAKELNEAKETTLLDNRENSAPKTRPQWKEAKREGESLPEFVARAYAAEREAGTLSKATLRADNDLYTDYFIWRRRKHLPPEMHWLRDLPTGTQNRDQQFAKIGINPSPTRIDDFSPEEQDIIRRYEAAKKRGFRSRHKPIVG